MRARQVRLASAKILEVINLLDNTIWRHHIFNCHLGASVSPISLAPPLYRRPCCSSKLICGRCGVYLTSYSNHRCCNSDWWLRIVCRAVKGSGSAAAAAVAAAAASAVLPERAVSGVTAVTTALFWTPLSCLLVSWNGGSFGSWF